MSYASRAGAKLEYALQEFRIDPKHFICADFGCSTGGFTDCLLQHGAEKVYAIDTAYGILDWKLRNDLRVVVMERTNALHINLEEKIDLITIDVSWTKQKIIIPHALTQLKKDGKIISLIKPHYEAPKKYLHNGKLEEEYVEIIVKDIRDILSEIVLVKKIIESPLRGEKGKNREFFLFAELQN